MLLILCICPVPQVGWYVGHLNYLAVRARGVWAHIILCDTNHTRCLTIYNFCFASLIESVCKTCWNNIKMHQLADVHKGLYPLSHLTEPPCPVSADFLCGWPPSSFGWLVKSRELSSSFFRWWIFFRVRDWKLIGRFICLLPGWQFSRILPCALWKWEEALGAVCRCTEEGWVCLGNQINIRLIGKIPQTDTDAKVVYIIPMLLDGRRTK